MFDIEKCIFTKEDAQKMKWAKMKVTYYILGKDIPGALKGTKYKLFGDISPKMENVQFVFFKHPNRINVLQAIRVSMHPETIQNLNSKNATRYEVKWND